MQKYIPVLSIIAILYGGCGSSDCCMEKETQVANQQPSVDEQGSVVTPPLSQPIPPVAKIAGQSKECVEGGAIHFDGRESSDADGHIVTYQWLMDNQVVATDPTPSFACDSIGQKEVCLQVIDDTNLSSMDCTEYSVVAAPKIPPLAKIVNSPAICTVGENILLDGTQSSDSDGEVVAYHWSYQDKEFSQDANATFACDAIGELTICLEVNDNDGLLSDKNCTTVIGQAVPNQVPIADLNLSANSCVVGETIMMDASKSYDPDGQVVDYNWSSPFTDVSGFFQGAVNTYNCTVPGKHTLCLNVVDDKGLESQKVCQDIVVSKPANQPPVAQITALPAECVVGEEILADGTTSYDPDGNVTAYHWVLDNNGTSTLPKPLFKCIQVGVSNLCLKVTDNEGAESNTTCQSVVVKAAVPAPIPPVVAMSLTYNLDDNTPSATATCEGSYDPDTIDGDNNPQNDGKILKAEFMVTKVVDVNGVEVFKNPHGGICPKWMSVPDNLKYIIVKLTVTDDDGQTATKTTIYDWDPKTKTFTPRP